jgi:hypothetical protein
LGKGKSAFVRAKKGGKKICTGKGKGKGKGESEGAKAKLRAESKRGEGAKAKQRAESKRGTKQNETKQKGHDLGGI